MSSKVVQFKTIGLVTFSRNRRSKNIKISVKPDKSVLVSFPFFCSTKEIVTFVQNNEAWILRQQKKTDQRRNRIDFGDKLVTKLHIIEFELGSKYSFTVDNEDIKITVENFDSDKTFEFIENILTQVYRFEAKILLPPKLATLAKKYNFKYEKVSIRNNKRNWGSCSGKNNISLNLQMMKLPDELIDYILLHELVHTEIKNHSIKFWDRLNEITDNSATELAKQVKQYSTYTL